jgi:hypothetical protein
MKGNINKNCQSVNERAKLFLVLDNETVPFRDFNNSQRGVIKRKSMLELWVFGN